MLFEEHDMVNAIRAHAPLPRRNPRPAQAPGAIRPLPRPKDSKPKRPGQLGGAKKGGAKGEGEGGAFGGFLGGAGMEVRGGDGGWGGIGNGLEMGCLA